MSRDLEADQGALTEFKERLARTNRSGDQFLALLEQKSVYLDTLARVMRDATRGRSYVPVFPSYIGLVQSGQLGLISDETF